MKKQHTGSLGPLVTETTTTEARTYEHGCKKWPESGPIHYSTGIMTSLVRSGGRVQGGL